MNIFVAVEVPPAATHRIQKQTDELRRDYPAFNWVPPQNYHLTLFYMGPVEDDRIEERAKKIEDAIYDIPVTHMFTYGTGLHIDEQITSYVTFQRNKVLEEINERIVELFGSEQQKRSSHFNPHLTIARYKIPSKQQYYLLKKKLNRLKIDAEFEVKEIHIFASIPKGKNPQYKKLITIPLLQPED